jgi:acetyltransferase-like isoleucine patch superfamily enzyme
MKMRRAWKNSSITRGWWLPNKLFDKWLLDRTHVWGDPTRIVAHETANLGNTLFNTISGDVYIGPWVNCGQNVCLLTGTHDYTKLGKERLLAIPKSGHDIHICEGAWLCSNVTLLGPCRVGDHSVIAAGAVVVAGTIVPPYSIYGGVPARQIGRVEVTEG